MAKIKNYWDIIKNEETHYYGGEQGWEVHLINQTHHQYNPRTGDCKEVTKLEFQWPSFDGVPKSERTQCRKDVLEARKKQRILAQASRDRKEYMDLVNRVNSENWEEILATGITGFDLGDYIRHKYLTHSEAYSLFYRM